MKLNNSSNLDNLRHSCAHLLAAAVMELYPQAKRTIGPAIEDGFYYDFDFGDIKISENDLPEIEAKMNELILDWKGFERVETTKKEAKKLFKDNPYKLELIEEFSTKDEALTLYKSGNYIDLCKGGHINSAGQIRHFKLLSVAGAYWRGSEKNKMLTRIYGTCFPAKSELEQYLDSIAEAEKRDHRKLSQTLDLYSISPLTGQGLILWHPKLAIMRNIVEQLWRDEHYQRGYQLVFTPHIASMDMFVISRHLSKYINYMFPVMMHDYIEGESAVDYSSDEVLKPMNCPNHIQIYKARPRSYRELPLRIGELGTVYRYERAGVLHGMTRVRGFTQDDSHIFCTKDQVITQIREVLKIMKYFYDLFGFKDYQAYIATRPEKFLGDINSWDFAQNSLKKAAELEKLDYKIDQGEGVFYGPKIDLKVKDSIGREWQLGTVQFDFNQPAKEETTEEDIEEFWKLKTFRKKFKTREDLAKYLKKLGRGFDVTYINKEGKEERCVMIHRVVLGSMERFFGILIEHYAGAFPLWLSPVQLVLIPISQRHHLYAGSLAKLLKASGIRVEVDERNNTMQAKIRDHTLQKVPYLGIIGDREIEKYDQSKKTKFFLALRLRNQSNTKTIDVEELLNKIKLEISSKI